MRAKVLIVIRWYVQDEVNQEESEYNVNAVLAPSFIQKFCCRTEHSQSCHVWESLFHQTNGSNDNKIIIIIASSSMLSFCMTVCRLQTTQTDDRTQFCIYFSIFLSPSGLYVPRVKIIIIIIIITHLENSWRCYLATIANYYSLLWRSTYGRLS